MRKLSILCACVLVFGLMAGQAFAISYCKDYLESGNAGAVDNPASNPAVCSFTSTPCVVDSDCPLVTVGETCGAAPSPKTFDEEVTLFVSDTVFIDIFVNDLPNGEVMLTSGFEIIYDDSIEIVGIVPSSLFPTANIDTTSTPGYATVNLLELATGVALDPDDDIYVAQLEIHCLAPGDDMMTIQPIIGPPQLDSVVSFVDGHVYDSEISANVFTFHQIKPCTTDASCDDSLYCNGLETCDLSGGSPGICEAGTPVVCDDGDYCTGGETCNEDTDSCDATGDPCAAGDGVYCNGVETCNEGADACDSAGDPCPGTECNTCQESEDDCTDPSTTACTSDDDVCTDDHCDGAGACVNTNNTAPCDDSDYCNGTDTCVDGACDDHAGDPCAAGNGLYCDGVETCNAGGSCDSPGNPCPANDADYCNGEENTCVEGPGCISPDPCPESDGDYCNGVEGCDDVADECIIDNPTPCDDGNSCTDDTCNEGTDNCGNDCNASSASDPCCVNDACETETICAADGYLDLGDQWANCGDVGVKIPICLINLDDEVGAVQVTLCETKTVPTAERCNMADPYEECTVSETPCDSDGDCDISQCAETGEDCVVDGDCPINVCGNGAPCTIDDDCPSWARPCVLAQTCDPVVQTCEEIGGRCSVLGSRNCTSDADCLNFCVVTGQPCVTTADCSYGDCPADTPPFDTQTCIDRFQCEVTGNECADNSDCNSSILVSHEFETDCLICVGCEMTERTTIFDCMVNEFEGCCEVIIFSKNPGGVLNPGECDIVVIDYTLKDDPECCTTCITINPENIVVVDQYGYDVEILTDDTHGSGVVCPFECGDIEPAGVTANYGCGDGDVDIFDILLEVDFIIHNEDPTPCQEIRADTPTGTPPYCDPPNGTISVADLMVIIDMALGRQDCCSYYYGGVIY